ncbi:MAG: hypothetical protein AAF215_11735 [Cyanobacteria bacterium P01_A01_bin.123]
MNKMRETPYRFRFECSAPTPQAQALMSEMVLDESGVFACTPSHLILLAASIDAAMPRSSEWKLVDVEECDRCGSTEVD